MVPVQEACCMGCSHSLGEEPSRGLTISQEGCGSKPASPGNQFCEMLIGSQVLQASNSTPKPGLACLEFPAYIHKVFMFTNSEGLVRTC